MLTFQTDVIDIMGSKKIHIDTPIIYINKISTKYLLNTEFPNVYWIDINKLYNDFEKKINIINEFIPIGQIYIDITKNKFFSTLMANNNIIPTSKSFEQIHNNIWFAYIKKNDTIVRSLGTIISKTTPCISIPVFPNVFLQKNIIDDEIHYMYKHLYSHKKYGKWMLNKFSFNMDKSNINIIDSTGEINNMFIPISSNDTQTDLDNNFNRKVYFTTQGSIIIDPNCISHNPHKTMSGLNINECNLKANDDGSLDNNVSTGFSNKKKTIILKEKNDPWFLDHNIMGDVLHTHNPHKVTGLINYDHVDEINMPTDSGCVTDKHIIGYSMDDKKNKCFGIEQFSSSHGTANSTETNFDIINNYNNYIVCIMCILIVILLLYRK